ncbi:MAG: aminotransferase class I/II-fold pyridoxal phosphate-dependent enzyme [Kordiimonadaceae bacterium]|nr:aminotransferase class I/II-fold pyridoxal phosphate-dependent enzyme [Kordiimonadaceae bacterium]MBT6031034.1 aminotransferase class I/II-fold pyridoxal phosphate-dependent enzyme [Kordiimonadaceae bacterium]
MTKIRVNENVTKAPPQPQPPANKVNPTFKINLAFNESPYPPSPKALEAYNETGKILNRYPNYSSSDLRLVLGKKYGLDDTRIMCTAGSEQILSFIARAFISDGDEVIYPRYGFMVYRFNIAMAGGIAVPIEHDDYVINVDNILNAVTDKTRVVFLDNPGNPTGTYVPYDEIKRLCENLPDHILLVLDAAYAEFATEDDYDAGLDLVDKHQNVIVTRTLSKLYGLSGLRIGWAYSTEEIIHNLQYLKGGFNVSKPAQTAGCAAVLDQEYADEMRNKCRAGIDYLTQELRAMGLNVTSSVCNFVMLHFPDGRDQMKAADAYLKENDICVGPLGAYGLDSTLRVTVGTDEENNIFIATMKSFMEK